MKKVAFLIKDPSEDWDGLRSALGLTVENNYVSFIVLDHEVEPSAPFLENLEWIREMEGEIYSNVPANVEKHGFTPITYEELGEKLREMDLIVPF